MNGFFLISHHLGWGVFSLAIFTGLFLLLADVVWRSTSIGIGRLGAAMSIGWIIGAGLILLGFYLGHA